MKCVTIMDTQKKFHTNLRVRRFLRHHFDPDLMFSGELWVMKFSRERERLIAEQSAETYRQSNMSHVEKLQKKKVSSTGNTLCVTLDMENVTLHLMSFSQRLCGPNRVVS